MRRTRWRTFLVLALVLIAVGAVTGHGFSRPLIIAIVFFIVCVGWDVARLKMEANEREMKRP